MKRERYSHVNPWFRRGQKNIRVEITTAPQQNIEGCGSKLEQLHNYNARSSQNSYNLANPELAKVP
jgi:hypothetical protein